MTPPEPNRQLSLFSDDIGRAVPPRPARLDPLFFAILLGPQVLSAARAIVADQCQRHYLRGALRPVDTLHVSVLGVGNFQNLLEPQIAAALAAGDAIKFAPFNLTFTEVVSFGRGNGPKPLVLPCGEGATDVGELARTLGAELAARGLSQFPRRSGAYHLTLLYDSIPVPPTPLGSPIEIIVREFALVRSLYGQGRYHLLRTWPLQA